MDAANAPAVVRQHAPMDEIAAFIVVIVVVRVAAIGVWPEAKSDKGMPVESAMKAASVETGKTTSVKTTSMETTSMETTSVKTTTSMETTSVETASVETTSVETTASMASSTSATCESAGWSSQTNCSQRH